MHQKRGTALLALFMALLLSGTLTGCGGKPEEASAGADTPSDGDAPSSAYTPPVNEEGYISVTMPVTLTGGNTAEELESEFRESTAGMGEEEIAQLFWSDLTANEDGSFNYVFTPEQFQRTKETSYLSGMLSNSTVSTYSLEFVTSAEYDVIDENGIPWSLAVSVDRGLYEAYGGLGSLYVTAAPALYIGMYQVLCGVSGEEWAVHVTVRDAATGGILVESDFPTRDA